MLKHHHLFTLLALPICLLLTSCSSTKDKSEALKLLPQKNELIGKIWSVVKKEFISKEQLLDSVYQSNYILLGETHDNTKHHEDHGWMITKIVANSPQSAIAFEMVNEDQAKTVNNTEFKNTDELLDTLEQAKTGWEYKKYYGPVFDAVLKGKLPVHAAEVNRETLMKIVSKGIEHAPKPVQEVLEKTKLSDETKDSLKKEIEMTHCGMANPEMTKAMMLGQRVRDAAKANVLYEIKNGPAQTAVLITGSGHIRKDRGAPFYLKALDPDAKMITIAWLEIESDVTDPLVYSKRWGVEQLPFDYVVFTAQVDRPDPCEEMRKYMQHKHGKKS